MNKPLLLTIGLIAIIGITSFLTWRIFDICADYNNTCSPTPTGSYVTVPPASPSATLSPVIASPSVSESTPTSTPQTQIGTPASANNISSPNAGASASVTAPTSAPDTGHVK